MYCVLLLNMPWKLYNLLTMLVVWLICFQNQFKKNIQYVFEDICCKSFINCKKERHMLI